VGEVRNTSGTQPIQTKAKYLQHFETPEPRNQRNRRHPMTITRRAMLTILHETVDRFKL